jgi:hypothetical protein
MLEDLLANDSLASTDLIIGFVPSQQVAAIAQYALVKKVNFVSAFSPSDAAIIDNPYFILINPTLQSNCEAIKQWVDKKRGNEQVFIFKRETVPVDSLAFHFMVDKKEITKTVEVDCHKEPDSAYLFSILDSNDRNIIVMPIMDALYAEKIIQSLHKYFPNYQFEYYGMPTWKGIATNKKTIDLGPNVSINITQPYYFDPMSLSVLSLNEQYRVQYGSKPNELTYRAYELLFWMTDLVNKYGAVFNEKTEDNSLSVFTHFELKPKWEDEVFYYIENRKLYLFHYQAGTVLVEQ